MIGEGKNDFFREEEKQNTREDARIGSRFSKRRQIDRKVDR